ncbi:MAG: NAD(P)/FAD-dependent oxidoreductase [Asticcacaulis sp.]
MTDEPYIVVGGGIVGLMTALGLQACGYPTHLFHDRALDASASAVAAGMIAPALEAAQDYPDPLAYHWLCASRDLWPRWLKALDLSDDISLDRGGTLWFAPDDPDRFDLIHARLVAMGDPVEPMVSGTWGELRPEIQTPDSPALYTPSDWRIAPLSALQILSHRFAALGGVMEVDQVIGVEAERVELRSGRQRVGRAVILACGYPSSPLRDHPALSVLSPIQGQLLAFSPTEPLLTHGACVRTPAGYLAPGVNGPVFGASMQVDRVDECADPALEATQRAAAMRHVPSLSQTSSSVRVGIRPSTADLWPLLGVCPHTRVWLNTGVRRNGWLLAPMMAALLTEALTGTSPLGFKINDADRIRMAWDPARFLR